GHRDRTQSRCDQDGGLGGRSRTRRRRWRGADHRRRDPGTDRSEQGVVHRPLSAIHVDPAGRAQTRMSTQRRLFLEALRFCARLPAGASKGLDVGGPGAAARYVPVVGLLIGAVGGAVYWLGAQLWPTSIAVVL